MTIEDNNDKQILSLNGYLFVDTVKVKRFIMFCNGGGFLSVKECFQ